MDSKRILILGPESTGKSTLAQDLSTYFREPWVPEFAREYLQNLDRAYDFDDLSTIAKGQISLEDDLFPAAKKFLFCDTDLRVIHIWSEYRFGKTESWILEEIGKRKYDFIFLCDIDLPWENDPLREHPEPEIRAELFELYLNLVNESGIPFAVISGNRNERLEQAVQILEQEF